MEFTHEELYFLADLVESDTYSNEFFESCKNVDPQRRKELFKNRMDLHDRLKKMADQYE